MHCGYEQTPHRGIPSQTVAIHAVKTLQCNGSTSSTDRAIEKLELWEKAWVGKLAHEREGKRQGLTNDGTLGAPDTRESTSNDGDAARRIMNRSNDYWRHCSNEVPPDGSSSVQVDQGVESPNGDDFRTLRKKAQTTARKLRHRRGVDWACKCCFWGCP